VTGHARLEDAQAAVVAAVAANGGLHLAPGGVDEARRRTTPASDAPGGPEVREVEDLVVAGPHGDVPVRRYCDVEDPSGAVVYLHSGGWVLGSVDGADALVRRLAVASGLEYFSVDYRKAPEHVAPAALDDARAVLRHVASLGRPVVVHGDSAGGAMAALLAQENDPEVARVLCLAVLVYPVTDADFTRGSYTEHAECGLLTAADMRWFWSLYAPAQDLAPLSPLRGDVARVPGAVVVTAGHDPLRDEGRAYAGALAQAGRPVSFREFPEACHGFFGLQAVSPAARQCLELVASCSRRAVGAAASKARS